MAAGSVSTSQFGSVSVWSTVITVGAAATAEGFESIDARALAVAVVVVVVEIALAVVVVNAAAVCTPYKVLLTLFFLLFPGCAAGGAEIEFSLLRLTTSSECSCDARLHRAHTV